ncbi:hypothetical protein [Nocardia aurantiaca]|uniref:hypothetical protein n=1 Tax=Nocardia aurantiaca TaxID=2675850 RepID=UPI0018A8C11E|nr:hypothetical protein [Nocardia aurantiaca]
MVAHAAHLAHAPFPPAVVSGLRSIADAVIARPADRPVLRTHSALPVWLTRGKRRVAGTHQPSPTLPQKAERVESMVRLVHSVVPAIGAVGALAVALVVPPLLSAAVPVRETAVAAGASITLTATGIGSVHGGTDPANAIVFRTPEQMRRLATGDESIAVLKSDIGDQRLSVSVVDGITDFATAAPRMLLPLRAAGVTVRFDGGVVDAGDFHGLTCVLPDTAGGVCAVAGSADVGVTVLVTGPTREAGFRVIAAVLSSSKAIEA